MVIRIRDLIRYMTIRGSKLVQKPCPDGKRCIHIDEKYSKQVVKYEYPLCLPLRDKTEFLSHKMEILHWVEHFFAL